MPSSPKERLREAAGRLKDNADLIDAIAEETRNGTVTGGMGETGKELLDNTLGHVKKAVKDIEDIIR